MITLKLKVSLDFRLWSV